MPQGRKTTHYSVPLTNMSIAYLQETGGFVSDELFPVIPSATQTGFFFQYSKPDFFRIKVKKRADFTTSEQSDYNIGVKGNYLIEEYSLSTPISDKMIQNSDNPLKPEEDAVIYLTEQMKLKKEKDFMDTFVKSGVWATEIFGVESGANIANKTVLKWSNPISNPIVDIRNMKREMLRVTGKQPNVLLLSRDVYDVLCEHENIISRIQYTQKGVLTHELLASLLDVDKIVVSNAIYNDSIETEADLTDMDGKNEDMKFFMNGVALFLYVAQRPGIRSASSGYCFTWTPREVTDNAKAPTIRTFEKPELGEGCKIIEASMSYDFQIVCNDLGIYLKDIL